MAPVFRILMVEDDPEQANLFFAVLVRAGYEVEVIVDAETAVARMREGTFNLALVDWDLPVMKGDALIRHIKLEYPDVKTVLFSNHYDVDRVARSSGADAWMRKSEGILLLKQIVAELLQPGEK